MDNQKFENAENIERDALLKCKDVLYKQLNIIEDNDTDVYIIISPPGSKDIYDALINVYKYGQKYRSFIIEVKVRNKEYNSLLLEKKKYDSLLKKQIEQRSFGFLDTKILYLNFTPKATYLFKISKHADYEWIKGEDNKYSVMKERGKVIKSKTYLETTAGDKLEYVYNYVLGENKLVERKLENQERVRCIFASLYKNEDK